MLYPGRNIKEGEKDAPIVKALKTKLNEVLVLEHIPAMRLDPNDPNFDAQMTKAVKLFQARNVDPEGWPLDQDGVVGALTWAALFGAGTVPSSPKPDDKFLIEVLVVAAGEEAKHVREAPRNSNRGPEVDQYQYRAGVTPPHAWCCAFVYWCFDEAAQKLARKNPMIKTAGCLDHWDRAKAKGIPCIPQDNAIDNPALVKSGMIFIIDHGGGYGHTGLIQAVDGGLLRTIEGNTDASGSREGDGVYRRTQIINDINMGFIDYTGR
jgi:hypothetical protein